MPLRSKVSEGSVKPRKKCKAAPVEGTSEVRSPKGKKRARTDPPSCQESKKSRTEQSSQSDETDISQMSESTKKVLSGRGITALFEIQAKAFRPAFEGRDVVGRAKTGCGKTLAFVLPLVERILSQGWAKEQTGRRTPLCISLAPTRELAKQILTDFEGVGGAAGLYTSCFYGGTPFGPQCEQARSGIDVLVCTPGRMLDHIRRGTIDLSRCRMLVLDEADEMLSMGFQEDVDAILNALPQDKVQKLLFSATIPKWVNALVSKHLHEPVQIDVAGEDVNATNLLIKHQCVSCPPQMRGDCIGDLCKIHAGCFGRTLVFTDTKKECDELATNEKLRTIGASVLHGDISQGMRETVMESFREGRVRCLVATDVAARGLDVPAVDLVVQTHPPTDLDKYVHRAGRTARGGREGTCVTFYSYNEEKVLRLLEHKKGIKLQRISPPQPVDVVAAAAGDAVKQLDHVHQDSVDAFADKARELIADRGADVALAAALAALTGHSRRLKGRSLLSAFEGYTAMRLDSEREFESESKGWWMLRNTLSQEIMGQIKGMSLCEGRRACIFDVPDDLVTIVLRAPWWKSLTVSVAKELPDLIKKHCDLDAAKSWIQQRWQRIRDHKKTDNFAGNTSRGTEQSRGRGAGMGRGSGRGSADRDGPRQGGFGRGVGRGRA